MHGQLCCVTCLSEANNIKTSPHQGLVFLHSHERHPVVFKRARFTPFVSQRVNYSCLTYHFKGKPWLIVFSHREWTIDLLCLTYRVTQPRAEPVSSPSRALRSEAVALSSRGAWAEVHLILLWSAATGGRWFYLRCLGASVARRRVRCTVKL